MRSPIRSEMTEMVPDHLKTTSLPLRQIVDNMVIIEMTDSRTRAAPTPVIRTQPR